MKTLLLSLSLAFAPLTAFAQDAAANPPPGDGPSAIDPAVAAPTPAVAIGWAKAFYEAVKNGQGWVAAMFLLFLTVGVVRTLGKKLYDWAPEGKLWDVPLHFLFQTKVGGWLLNWLTAIAGCLGTAYMAGSTIDAGAWKVAVMASSGGTVLIELKDDLWEWWQARQAAKAAPAPAKPPPAPPGA